MRGFGVVLAGALVCAGTTGASARPPVEAFGSLPFLSQPQLSPDGKHFAGIQELDGKPAAVIYTVGAGARRRSPRRNIEQFGPNRMVTRGDIKCALEF